MSRKHFQRLAVLVNDQHQKFGYDAADWLAKELALICKMSNPNFDEGRFRTTCGLD